MQKERVLCTFYNLEQACRARRRTRSRMPPSSESIPWARSIDLSVDERDPFASIAARESSRADLSSATRGDWHADLSACYMTRPRQIFWQRSKTNPAFSQIIRCVRGVISRADFSAPTFFLPSGIRSLMPRRLAGPVINVDFINKWKSRGSRYILFTCQGRNVHSLVSHSRVCALADRRPCYLIALSLCAKLLVFSDVCLLIWSVSCASTRKNRYVRKWKCCNFEISEFR